MPEVYNYDAAGNPAGSTCNGTIDLADGRTLACVLSAGHDGPVHEDDQGEQWGDPALTFPADHPSARAENT